LAAGSVDEPFSRLVYPKNTGPLDLEEVYAHYLQSDDVVSQKDISLAINQRWARVGKESDNFLNREEVNKPLSDFRIIRDTGSEHQAVDLLLKKRTRVKLVDGIDFYPNDHPGTFYNSNEERSLDFVCIMGNRMGLDAAMTSQALSVSNAFNLDIQPHYAFPGKFAQLGADQKEALLRIGFRSNREDVYIFMAPKELLSNPSGPVPEAGLCTGGDTRMQLKYSRILVAYFAYVLANMRSSTRATYSNPYEMPITGKMNWNAARAL
jgi:hypothetical protein